MDCRMSVVDESIALQIRYNDKGKNHSSYPLKKILLMQNTQTYLPQRLTS